jgi:hypothetical protein
MSIFIANETITLPAPENIPTLRTRAALEKVNEILEARKEAWSNRDHTSKAAQNLKNAEPVRRGRAMVEGVDAGESPVAAAEAAAKRAQEDLDAALAAETFAAAELRAAVVADREAWQAAAAAEAQKALIKLATAVRMATEAGAVLHDQIGVLGMFHLHGQNGGGRLAPFHPRGSSQFDINAGIEGLRAGLSSATSELARFKPAKPGKGKRAAVAEDVDE